MRLIDADALIAETMKNRCADCDRRKGIKQGKMTFVYDFGEVPCRACDVGDMIDTLDETPTIGGWISVKDRLPRLRQWVLCKCRAGIYEVLRYEETCDGEHWYHDNLHNYMSGFVTHWMPLPEPPTEDA